MGNNGVALGGWKTAATWIARIIVGGVFVFSGFVKAVDPWGTIYKFDEYLAAMDFGLWPNLLLVGVFSLCALEFMVGVFMVFGCFRRLTAWLGLSIMCFMLPLSFWVAVADPVADCGCFGDALVISNWTTFFKNILLTVGALWLVLHLRSTHWLVTPAIQWIAFVASGLFIVGISLAGYIYQPLVDFRPYPVGERLIPEEDESDVDENEFEFVYQNNGETVVVSENDELPDEADGWKFVERREIRRGGGHASSDGGDKLLRIWDEASTEDVTYSVIHEDGRQIILFMPQLSDVSIASSWQINSLYTWASRLGIDMFAVVGASGRDIEKWVDLSMPSYPIYTAEDTSIKEVARGNPSVVYIEDGVIRWKSSLRALDSDDFLADGTSDDPMFFARNDRRMLISFAVPYFFVMAILVILSFATVIPLRTLSRKMGLSIRGGKAPR